MWPVIGLHSECRLQALPSNIRLGWKVKIFLAYFKAQYVTLSVFTAIVVKLNISILNVLPIAVKLCWMLQC